MSAYKHLLTPIQINGRTFKNRVFSSSHAPGYAEEGLPGERYQAYHEEKAKGGIGLTMFGGSSNVSRDSGSIYGQIYVGDDRVIPAFRQFAERVHRYGAGLICQITHMGRRTTWDSGDWLPTKGPSAKRDPAHHSSPYEISTREIHRIVKAFAAGAKRCREGGLDGVEIIASTHILGQFLSPISNFRDDGYGGSLENRARFLLEVLEAVRSSVGDDFIVSLRFNGDESNENGLDADDGEAIAKIVANQGTVNILNVNGAYGGSDMGMAEYMPGMAFKSAPFVQLAARIKQATGLTVFQASRLSDPATANWAIENGYLDMAGMTRPHVADPHIVNKLLRNEEERIRPCVGAGYCLDRVYAGRDMLCQHNPSTGRESWLSHEIDKSGKSLKAVIVGGGPAGLEASRVLGLRGHDVTLFEAGPKLGGQIQIAARGGWRRDMIGITDWLENEVSLLDVDVHLNHYAQASDVTALNPDLVIIATGGIPASELPEHGDESILSVWDALDGSQQFSGEVLIYDSVGAHAALSLADKLAAEGCALTFVTPDRQPARAIGGQNYPVYLRNLYRAGVKIITSHELLGANRFDDHIEVRLKHAFSREIMCMQTSTVIADLGLRSLSEVFDELTDLSKNFGEYDPEKIVALEAQPMDANPAGQFALFRIGDALAQRDLHAAIFEANRLCRVM